MIKISYCVYFDVMDCYVVLCLGGVLGWGVGLFIVIWFGVKDFIVLWVVLFGVFIIVELLLCFVYFGVEVVWMCYDEVMFVV